MEPPFSVFKKLSFVEAFSWRIMNFVQKFEGRNEKQLVPWEKAKSRQQNKIPKTKIIINQHVKIANCHGWQLMLLSCIMLKNLAVNLPMSNKVDCAHYIIVRKALKRAF